MNGAVSMSFGDHKLPFLLCIRSGAKFPSHGICIFSALVDPAKQFSKGFVPVYTPTITVAEKSYNFFTSLPMLNIVILILSILVSMKWYLILVLNETSLMTTKLKDFFLYLLAI
jgi:hypothetical protein